MLTVKSETAHLEDYSRASKVAKVPDGRRGRIPPARGAIPAATESGLGGGRSRHRWFEVASSVRVVNSNPPR